MATTQTNDDAVREWIAEHASTATVDTVAQKFGITAAAAKSLWAEATSSR